MQTAEWTDTVPSMSKGWSQQTTVQMNRRMPTVLESFDIPWLAYKAWVDAHDDGAIS